MFLPYTRGSATILSCAWSLCRIVVVIKYSELSVLCILTLWNVNAMLAESFVSKINPRHDGDYAGRIVLLVVAERQCANKLALHRNQTNLELRPVTPLAN